MVLQNPFGSDLGPQTKGQVVLLMEEILHHLVCIKPCKKWDILFYVSTGARFLPSTVSLKNCTQLKKRYSKLASVQFFPFWPYIHIFSGIQTLPFKKITLLSEKRGTGGLARTQCINIYI